jgi:hypothetical protein
MVATGERENAHENAMKPSDTSHAVAAHAADRMTCWPVSAAGAHTRLTRIRFADSEERQ